MASIVMFFVVTLVSLCMVAASMTNALVCSAGMIKRGNICCKPKICEINQYYRLCNNTYREDSCIGCPPNTTNQDIINTSLLYEQIPGICKDITGNCNCLPEARLTNLHDCLRTGNATCECNLDIGFCSEDPKTCRKWEGNVTDLATGVGLTQSCQVENCKPGYYKDKVGYGQCLKHKECSLEEEIIFKGNSTMNRQCGPLTQTTTPTKSTKIFDANSTSPSSDGTADTDKIPVIIGSVVGCIILIVVIFVVVAIIYRRRRGRNNANPGDEEQNRGLAPNGQRMEPQLPNGREGSEPLTNGQGMVDTAC